MTYITLSGEEAHISNACPETIDGKLHIRVPEEKLAETVSDLKKQGITVIDRRNS